MAWLCNFTPSLSIWTEMSILTNYFEKFFEKLFLWFLRVRIYPLTYTHKNRVLGGCFEEWFTVCLQKQSSDTSFFHVSKVDSWFSGKRKMRSFKIYSSPICMKTAFCGGGFEKDSQYIYRISAFKKTSSTYIHKNSVLSTLLKEMFTVCLQITISQQILSPNSHRKDESKPL